MYDIFTYMWLIFMVNVGKYTIHGSSGKFWVRLFVTKRNSNIVFVIIK